MRLPHLVPFARHPIVFLTTGTRDRTTVLANATAFQALRNIWIRSTELHGWIVGRFVVMPDHLHLFARPHAEAVALADWVRNWKSLSSRTLSRMLGQPPPLWQPDYFDHFVRSAQSYSEKWDYVRHNPVRAQLAARAEDWPWQGEIEEIRF